MKRTLRAIALIAALTSAFERSVLAQISDDPRTKTVTISTRHRSLSLRVNYAAEWRIDGAEVLGREVLEPSAGITTGLKIDGSWQNWGTSPKTRVIVSHELTFSGDDPFFRTIGAVITPVDDEGRDFTESWGFRLRGETIEWTVNRSFKKFTRADEVSFARCSFKDSSTWSGAILGTGGVAWSPRFQSPNATFGVHTGKAILWNREHDDALEFEVVPNTNYVSALRFTSQRSGALEMSLAINPDRLATRYGVARFLPDRADVWQPIEIEPYTTSVTLRLQAHSYASQFDRGEMKGVDESSVRELMNTIARFGVVDDTFMGSNGWNGVALHEPWIAQLGIAIDDANYVASFAKTMNEERDHAMATDGRVKSRWTSNANDAEPGTYDEHGYYEAQWGRLLDSQTSYVINAADQFDLSGDVDWMRGQKEPCERALEFLLRRDADGDGLVEADSDSCKNRKSSDWIDVVWASHESAYINAQLYEALRRLAEIERVLGDDAAAKTYESRALRLKEAFDRPTTEGGFWSAEHAWYVYWREPDDSIHGDNLTVPVNLMAIAYGLCDDEKRIRAILDRIEQCMQSEKLFFWPLCVLPFALGEANEFQYPFPNYENGDLFLAFGELGTRAYVKTDPRIAFRIVKNVLARFEKDGLAFQRYLRTSQQGAGDDILSNNCSAIVGLYRNLYGIVPKWNRLDIEPHLVPEIVGTKLNYRLRGIDYRIELAEHEIAATAMAVTLRRRSPFGIAVSPRGVSLFSGEGSSPRFTLRTTPYEKIDVDVMSWPDNKRAIRRFVARAVDANVEVAVTIHDLPPNADVEWKVDGESAFVKSDALGEVTGQLHLHPEKPQFIEIQPRNLPGPLRKG